MGASSSKAAAVQKTASRAAAAAKPAPAAAAATAAAASAAPEAAARPGVSAAERQRAAQLASVQQQQLAMPAERAQDNEQLVNTMNKLMSGVQQYQYQLYRNPEVDRRYAVKKKTKEEKEAELVGRLASPAFKALLEEHARAVRQGRQLTAADLARRYGADAEVLEKVLQHNSAPAVQAAPDGRLIGTWPKQRSE